MKLSKIYGLRIAAIALLLVGLFSIAIGLLSRLNTSVTKISELAKKRDTNSTVYVQGKVIKQIPFLGSRAYQIQDASGTILVITKKEFPPENKEVLIKGKLQYKSIPLGGREFGEVYVKEQERL